MAHFPVKREAADDILDKEYPDKNVEELFPWQIKPI